MSRESKDLRTVFSYYGGKAAIANKYPPPMYPVIVEPFAGSAAYSQLHHYCKVFLFDANPDIVATWEYLIRATARDILALPDIDMDTRIRELDIPIGAQNLIGFMGHKGSTTPSNPNCRSIARGFWNTSKIGIAKLVHRFNHWEVKLCSWEGLIDLDLDLTWFIDPPYVNGGALYPYNSIDYLRLSDFCKARYGQVIVCERPGSTWLPFSQLTTQYATKGLTHEGMWYKHNSAAEKQLLSKVYAKKLRSTE